MLFGLAVYIIQSLQMAWLKKSSVLIAFGLRLAIIVPIAFRLHNLSKQYNSSDPTYDGLLASIWTQVEIAYAVLSATIPCYGSWVSATSTQVPIQPKKTRYHKYGSGNGSQGHEKMPNNNPNNISMHSIFGRKKDLKNTSQVESRVPASSKDIFSWPNRDNTSCIATPGDEHSTKSNESRQGIIRKDVDWTVSYEDAPIGHYEP